MAKIPNRNLPPDAEMWGRSVDERLRELESLTHRSSQGMDTSFSNINGNLAALGRQMEQQVWGGYVSDVRTGFGVSTAWANPGYGAIMWPARATSAFVLATGIGTPVQSSGGSGTDYLAYGRLNINNILSPEVPGVPFATSTNEISLVQTSWSAFVVRGDYPQIDVKMEMRAGGAGWYTYNAASKAQVSAIVLFNADSDITV